MIHMVGSMLLFFPPIGFYGVYKSETIRSKWKKLTFVTLVLGVLFAMILYWSFSLKQLVQKHLISSPYKYPISTSGMDYSPMLFSKWILFGIFTYIKHTKRCTSLLLEFRIYFWVHNGYSRNVLRTMLSVIKREKQ